MSSLSQLLLEIQTYEKEISILKKNKTQKEFLIEDLKSLIERISEETAFSTPYKKIQTYKKIRENTLYCISSNTTKKAKKLKSDRKQSGESEFSMLSKCVSHTTKASSIMEHEEDGISYHSPFFTNNWTNEVNKAFNDYNLKGHEQENGNGKKLVSDSMTNSNSNNSNCSISHLKNNLQEKSLFSSCLCFWEENIHPKYN